MILAYVCKHCPASSMLPRRKPCAPRRTAVLLDICVSQGDVLIHELAPLNRGGLSDLLRARSFFLPVRKTRHDSSYPGVCGGAWSLILRSDTVPSEKCLPSMSVIASFTDAPFLPISSGSSGSMSVIMTSGGSLRSPIHNICDAVLQRLFWALCSVCKYVCQILQPHRPLRIKRGSL